MLAFLRIVSSARMNLKFHIDGSEKWFNQFLDHNDPETWTFRQKYYENFNYVAGGQFENVVLYVGGESDLRESTAYRDSFIELANRTNSAIFAIEHRFYGDSQPFTELTSENLKYLSIDQALEDYVTFIKFIDAHPMRNKNPLRLVIVGGSYTGAISSWFRLKHPEYAIASWASSAPVNIKNEFQEYDEYVAQQLEEISPNCLSNAKTLLKQAETVIRYGSRADIDSIKKTFGFSTDTNDISFLYVMTDILCTWVQYNSNTHYMDRFCKEQSEVADWNTFVITFNQYLTETQQTPADWDLLAQNNVSIYNPYHNGRAWSWQTCTEVGWFQTASGKLRSSLINISYFQNVCETLFGIEQLPDEKAQNKKYGGVDPDSTNVYYNYGSVDPWTTLGVTESKFGKSRIRYLIQGESHCADLSAYSPDESVELTDAKERTISYEAYWMTNK